MGRTRVVRRSLAVSVLLAVSVALAQSAAQELRKLPPDYPALAYRMRITGVIAERYPALLAGNSSGTPVVTVLFNPDGTVAATRLETLGDGVRELTVSEAQFAPFGEAASHLQYIAAAHMALPGTTALVVFAQRDSHELDRTLVERYFPEIGTQKLPPDTRLWLLFTHEGTVVRSGEEPLDPGHFPKTLERRFPGVHTTESSLTAVIAPDGKPFLDTSRHPLQLECVWLSADSRLP